MEQDIIFMERALQIALHGLGHVSPNPMVGCVIVHNGKIIGEGWHKKFGGPHAEVEAVDAVVDKAVLAESTCYVTLEPCAHFGKTPPCANLLVHHRFTRVVIATEDPNPLVAGNGVAILKKAGIEVKTGILEREAQFLNRRFFTQFLKMRAYIILKWAQTADGFIAQKNFNSKWISNESARQLVHQWRSQEDAVLVGSHTAACDNPMLTTRLWPGRNPSRIVLDRFLRLPKSLHVFNREAPTLVFNVLRHEEGERLAYIRVSEQDFLKQVFEECIKRNIQSVIVEGGATILHHLIEQNLWDEARIFTASKVFTDGIKAPELQHTKKAATVVRLNEDSLNYFYNPSALG